MVSPRRGLLSEPAEQPAFRTRHPRSAYYEYVAHQYVTYWFFYAHNDAPTALFDHEGDWERISVKLDKANRATAVAYHQYKGYCTRSWQEAGKHEGHPLAYSALGTHATYPWLGAYEIAGASHSTVPAATPAGRPTET
ncbi:hypothetical protein AB0M50_28050 [Nonomuraea fuscirosea]|uniref:hypothetical protein n=1 Tax=Nonomuraea fuscirosea TaxID=1291556 RepID=UPI00343E16CE